MKNSFLVALLTINMLVSCENSSYDIINNAGLEQKSEFELSEAQTRSNLSLQDYSIKNLQSIVGHEIRISLNTTSTSEIYLTKKPIKSGSAPWIKSMREPNSSNVQEQYWMLVKTNYSYGGKPAFGIKTVTCDKVLSKNQAGTSNGQTSVREPVGKRIYNIYDKRDLWLFEYDENAKAYLIINAEAPSMCLVRKSGADASNPLQLIPKNEILYHQAHWNIASVEKFDLVSINYLSTSPDNIVIEDVSVTDILFENKSEKPFNYEKTYEQSVSNETYNSWTKEFTLSTNTEIGFPNFIKDTMGLKVSISTTNKWLSESSSKTSENVKVALKISQTIPPNDILKIKFSAIKYKGTIFYEAVVRGSKGLTTTYGKWEGAIHQDIRITLLDNSGSKPIDDSNISYKYTRQ